MITNLKNVQGSTVATIKEVLSLTVLLVAKCTRQEFGSVLLRSSLITAYLNGEKETAEVFYEKKSLDCAADHVSLSVLVGFTQKLNHLLMKPSHTVFTQWR